VKGFKDLAEGMEEIERVRRDVARPADETRLTESMQEAYRKAFAAQISAVQSGQGVKTTQERKLADDQARRDAIRSRMRKDELESGYGFDPGGVLEMIRRLSAGTADWFGASPETMEGISNWFLTPYAREMRRWERDRDSGIDPGPIPQSEGLKGDLAPREKWRRVGATTTAAGDIEATVTLRDRRSEAAGRMRHAE
jgi:hypothetical protein